MALKPVITGGLFLCPMLVIAADTRPAYIIELIARGISKVAGSFPLAAANKGKNSEDPRLEEQFLRVSLRFIELVTSREKRGLNSVSSLFTGPADIP